ncbi:MAG: hypothetical protein IKE30_01675 [Clostridia bacterium]|nr:hypothetical protein [Clostridia bacterium]
MAARKKAQPAPKPRKTYPSRPERISMAEQKIERLEKLNASRRDLIARSEAKLNDRKAALARTEAQLDKEIRKRDRLIAIEKDPDGRTAANRQARAAEKAEVAQVIKLMREKGMSLSDIESLLNQ